VGCFYGFTRKFTGCCGAGVLQGAWGAVGTRHGVSALVRMVPNDGLKNGWFWKMWCLGNNGVQGRGGGLDSGKPVGPIGPSLFCTVINCLAVFS
jgi:hypothetical protein